MDLEQVDGLVAHWRKLRPRVLTTLPSYLPMLASIGSLRRYGIEAITTNSEMSSREERSRYSQLFDVPVLDEYSSEEIGFMATECLDGRHHVVEDGVYMEIADADSEGVGRVVVTDLGNYLMPLIRYDHGDLARLSNGSCRCGRSFRGLDALHGRRDDALIAADGRYVPTASVMAACDALLTDERSGMNEYRLIQCSANQIELHYVRSPGSGTDSALRLRLSKTGCLISLVIVLSFRLSATTHYRHSRAINAGYCSGRGMDADEHVFMHGICAATRTDGNGCVFARSGTQVDRRKVRRRHRGRIASRSGRHLLARGQCYRLRSRWTGVHRCWLPRPHACASSHCIAWNWHPFLHRRSCNQKAEYRSLQYSARQCRQCCGVRTRHHHRQCCGCRRQCGRRADRELLAADAVEKAARPANRHRRPGTSDRH